MQIIDGINHDNYCGFLRRSLHCSSIEFLCIKSLNSTPVILNIANKTLTEIHHFRAVKLNYFYLIICCIPCRKLTQKSEVSA
jgi:hypothetical protein